jgi:hypothetical protein
MSIRSRALGLCLVLVSFCLAARAFAGAKFIVFDAPNAQTGSSGGTTVTGLDDTGLIVGWRATDESQQQGYIRKKNGSFVAYQLDVTAYPNGVAKDGLSVGLFKDLTGIHAFIANRKGGIETTFDVQDDNGLSVTGINEMSMVTGTIADVKLEYHGYIRDTRGAIVLFDAPGAGTTGDGAGTFPQGIAEDGTVCGWVSVPGLGHQLGFVHSSDGTIVSFNPRRSVQTYALSVGGNDVVVGYYFDSARVKHGFLRASDGTMKTYDARGAGTNANQGTVVNAINGNGDITGTVIDRGGLAHGFVRSAAGKLVVFDAPGAGTAVQGEGTYSFVVNVKGQAAGIVVDSAFNAHGFLRTP